VNLTISLRWLTIGALPPVIRKAPMKALAPKRHLAPLILRIPPVVIPGHVIKTQDAHGATYFANAGTA